MNTSTRATVTLWGLHKPAAEWIEFQANNSIDACGFDDDLAREVRDLAECGLVFDAALVDTCDITRGAANENHSDVVLEAIDVPVQGLVLLLCHYLRRFEPDGFIAFEFDLNVGGFVNLTQAVVITSAGPDWYPNAHQWLGEKTPRGKTKINS